MTFMATKVVAILLTLLLLSPSFSSAATVSSSPSKIVNGVVSNAVAQLVKWFWSIKSTTKTAISGKPMMKYESGYTVETVFDGSKLGIEPHSVEVLNNGELLILDSANSNLYKISSSLSLYSRPKLIAGSADGYAGHIDAKMREARMNHPKGLTVDDRGNVYIADTDNMAIRKISDTGVTTIAGGKWGRGGGHVDGPSEDAKFSNDFDVVYIGSSCSLLVIDRGNNAIREIQLRFDDCAYQYGSGFPLGIAVLVAAGFFGYMLALLQRRVGSIVSPQIDEKMQKLNTQSPYKRQPLIPGEDEQERQEETFFISLGKLVSQASASAAEILAGVFPSLRKKVVVNTNAYEHEQVYPQVQKYTNTWPVQESYVIKDEDEAPMVEAKTPTPRKTYAFMSKDYEKMQQLKQSRVFYSGWEGENVQSQKQQNHNRYSSSIPQTYYEQNAEKTNEIVFGAVQEQDGQREAPVIKPLDHSHSVYNRQNIRFRNNS